MTEKAHRARVLVAWTAVAVLLAPAALAEHTYAHQYLIVGRILDQAGDPVAGERVEMGSHGVPVIGVCPGYDQRLRTTDDRGDFAIYLHTHDYPHDAGFALVVNDVAYGGPADALVRSSGFFLFARNVTGDPKPDDWSRVYRVDGKVWQQTDPGHLEGVPVLGVAAANETVALAFTTRGLTFNATATTDRYGEYNVLFNLPFDAAAGNVTASALGANTTTPLQLDFMRSRVAVRAPGSGPHASFDKTEPPMATFPDQPDTTARPGATSPGFAGSFASWFAAVAMGGAVLGVGLYARARRRLKE